jgi:hypothetical protein
MKKTCENCGYKDRFCDTCKNYSMWIFKNSKRKDKYIKMDVRAE